jgi:hypothetical protein
MSTVVTVTVQDGPSKHSRASLDLRIYRSMNLKVDGGMHNDRGMQCLGILHPGNKQNDACTSSAILNTPCCMVTR